LFHRSTWLLRRNQPSQVSATNPEFNVKRIDPRLKLLAAKRTSQLVPAFYNRLRIKSLCDMETIRQREINSPRNLYAVLRVRKRLRRVPHNSRLTLLRVLHLRLTSLTETTRSDFRIESPACFRSLNIVESVDPQVRLNLPLFNKSEAFSALQI
jgi:DNA mismatch repair ATPase MutS